ncbi:MAG: rod shape-determining protein MreC [Deltaproteobacteria bacterium]|nr:rod shape-determining protein MreC [Deltaproteobacteria bacterium]
MKRSPSKHRLKFFLFFLLIALGLVFWLVPSQDWKASFFQEFFSPVFALFEKSEDLAGAIPPKLSQEVSQAEQIENLQIQVQSLENKLFRVEAQLQSLSEAKGLEAWAKSKTFSGQVARVLVQDVSSHRQSLMINRGASSGLKRGQAVLAREALVGRVDQVWNKTARVLLINDQLSRVDVQTQASKARGSLHGSGGALDLERAPYVTYAEYFDQKVPLEEGELLLTSGQDGLFPPGLPVAKLLKVEKDSTGLFWEGQARPLVELSQLSTLWVLSDSGSIKQGSL